MPAKVYLRSFDLVSSSCDMNFVLGQKMTCFNGIYPFKLFPNKGLRRLEFEPITIFYGGNGSGKTTLLNIIAKKAKIARHSETSKRVLIATSVRRYNHEVLHKRMV